MTEDQYLSLCEKFLLGNCTREEELLIKEYQDTHAISNSIWNSDEMGDRSRIRFILDNKLQSSIRKQQPEVRKLYRWQYAAAAAIILSLGILFNINNKQPAANIIAHKQAANEILPGTNKAVLTLANGKHIVLDTAKNGLLKGISNTAISKTGNSLVFKGNSSTTVAVEMATVTIPRGGKYDIVLPDGTKVWLNSASSLAFPSAFTGDERLVSLTGEAYFEVAKNKRMPFKINVDNKQTVEVLGTHFNISAYNDDHRIATTLLEGSVKINYNNHDTYIKPGEVALNDLGPTVVVKPADIEETMAWKNGMFVFDDNITGIMKQVSRWYDVDVVFKGKMAGVNFTGNYSRSKSLNSLLKNIMLMDKVNFIVEGRRVTVIAK